MTSSPVNNSTQRRRPKVFIVNRGCHNYSAAEAFGELVFMTDGVINRYAASEIYRYFQQYLADSQADDYLLISGMSTMLCIASSILSAKHQCLNMLIYKNGKYLKRNITHHYQGEQK